MLHVPMRSQPDDFTCGPTSLQAVYGYFGEELDIPEVMEGVQRLDEGGTLAVHLGRDALRRGYRATIHSYNLRVFDPAWSGYDMAELDLALEARSRVKTGKKLLESIQAYRAFIQGGGTVDLSDITPAVLRGYFDAGLPVLAGLSATYLYGGPRERPERDAMVADDIAGEPQGHFVVLCGFEGDRVVVADPYRENPLSRDHHYRVDIQRLIHAILLGVLTYDGNLLVLSPAPVPGS